MVQFIGSRQNSKDSDIKLSGSTRKVFRKKLKLDEKGRIVLPVSLRKSLMLEEGDSIEIVFTLSDTKALLVFFSDYGNVCIDSADNENGDDKEVEA